MAAVEIRESCTLTLSEEIVQSVMFDNDIAALFDDKLCYSLINAAACKQLDRTSESLIGKCILDLYPQITASKNHRSLLRALEGDTVSEVIEGMQGGYFRSVYIPVFFLGKVTHVLVKATKIHAS